jgi:hypothetical protein
LRPYPLPPALRRVCYFSHFDPGGSIAPHTLLLIDSITLIGFHVVFISCSPWLTPLAQRQLQHRGVTCARTPPTQPHNRTEFQFHYPPPPHPRAPNACCRYMLRRNIGRDFGSWAVGFSEFPFQPDASGCSGGGDCDVAVLLANDSVFGPFLPLAPAIFQFFSSGADLFGLTESLEVCA